MADSIEDQIARYPMLSREQQRAVEKRVAERPALQDMLREMKGLAEMVAEARRMIDTPPSDEAMAYYLLTERLAAHPLPEAMQRVVERVEDYVDAHPSERRRLRTFEERLRTLEENSTDAVEQFETLTGHTLSETAAEQPAAAYQEADARSPSRVSDRNPASRADRDIVRWSRRAAIAVLLLAGLYGVLFLASRATQSDAKRLAAFGGGELSLKGYHMRGGGSAASSDSAAADARYLRALSTLRKARTTTLGLFPRYDATRLRRASRLLRQVIAQTEVDSFLHLEALYVRGKTQLALGQKEAARSSLRRVVEGQGRKADAARDILAELEGA